MTTIIINDEFTQLCLEKYKAMIKLNQKEEFLDQEIYGGIKIFINSTEKPKYFLAQFISEDGQNNQVFVGGTY